MAQQKYNAIRKEKGGIVMSRTYTASDEMPNCMACDNACLGGCETYCGPAHGWNLYRRTERAEILNCPACEDRDCSFNAGGLCHSINTIKDNIPDGMFTCSGANVEFKRSDYSII